jgi:hypothetical protein
MDRQFHLIKPNPNYKPFEFTDVYKAVGEYRMALKAENKYTDDHIEELVEIKGKAMMDYETGVSSTMIDLVNEFLNGRRRFCANMQTRSAKEEGKLKALDLFAEELMVKRYKVTITEEHTGKHIPVKGPLGVRHQAAKQRHVVVE